jgi:hypothetical protein
MPAIDIGSHLPSREWSMSVIVIKFPIGFSERRKAASPTAPHTDLGTAVDIAAWIHDLIMDGLNSGELFDCSEGPYGALEQFLQDRCGRDLAAAAEGCFEVVYGCDSYTFLIRVIRRRLQTVRHDS